MKKYDRTSVYKRDILGQDGKQFVLPWGAGKTMSTLEAGKLLGVSHDTVRRMCEAGELQGWPIRDRKGSPMRVATESVYDYLAKKITRHSITPVDKMRIGLPQPQNRTPRTTK